MENSCCFGLERGINGGWVELGSRPLGSNLFPTSAGAAQLLHQANRLRTEIRIFWPNVEKTAPIVLNVEKTAPIVFKVLKLHQSPEMF